SRDRLLAPAGGLGNRPNATVIQVSAMVSRPNMATAPTQSAADASGRKPIATATASTSAPLSIVRRKLPSTVPVSTDMRLMAIVRKRVMIPSVMSVLTATAVASAPAAAA